jgi:uncharacterized MAPEG superfamily protein
MTLELISLLVLSHGLVALGLAYSLGDVRAFGVTRVLGNRHEFPSSVGWVERGRRAHLNLLENLVPFAVVVLIGHATGAHDRVTAAACVTFVLARAVHAGSYLAGVTIVRSVAHHTGTLASVILTVEILRIATWA